MAEKRFYLALRRQDKDANVDDALYVLADVLTGEGRIYVEDIQDLENFVRENRYMWIGNQVQRVRKERAECPQWGFMTLSRSEEEQLEDKFRQEYGQLPVYEFTIRKIGFTDDGQEARFHRTSESEQK